jgi:hypothetical protein
MDNSNAATQVAGNTRSGGTEKKRECLSALWTEEKNKKSGKDIRTEVNRQTDLAHHIEEHVHHKARFKSRFLY